MAHSRKKRRYRAPKRTRYLRLSDWLAGARGDHSASRLLVSEEQRYIELTDAAVREQGVQVFLDNQFAHEICGGERDDCDVDGLSRHDWYSDYGVGEDFQSPLTLAADEVLQGARQSDFSMQQALNASGERWTIEELTSSKALRDEGSALGHCVAGYARYCVNGSSAIFSLRCNRKRKLMIELDVRSRALRQARGRANRSPRANEMKLIGRWLQSVVHAAPRGDAGEG